VPTALLVGVPDKRPFVLLNDAHAGKFDTLKERVSPSGSLAVGVKVYAEPAATEVPGVPDTVGAEWVPVEVPVDPGVEPEVEPEFPLPPHPARTHSASPSPQTTLIDLKRHSSPAARLASNKTANP
jgi:hypothetical protein